MVERERNNSQRSLRPAAGLHRPSLLRCSMPFDVPITSLFADVMLLLYRLMAIRSFCIASAASLLSRKMKLTDALKTNLRG